MQLYPLVVDMDGSLLATDFLVEGYLRLALRQPGNALKALHILTRHGRLEFKHFIAQTSPVDPTRLPLRREVLKLIEDYKRAGHSVILASASPESAVRKLGEHLGNFDAIIGSRDRNLKGLNKLSEVQQLCPEGFDYVGDSRADVPLWRDAKRAYVVGSPSLVRESLSVNRNTEWVTSSRTGLQTWLKALRVHHWVKNVLIFAAPMAAHRLGSPEVLVNSLLMFLAFSLTASAVYIGNDLSDLDNDRIHPRKRNRPIASGALSISKAVIAMVMLATGALTLTGLTTSPMVTLTFLGIYILTNILYSIRFKSVYGLDIVILSVLYTLRVVMGADGNGIPTTSWFNSFFVFIFLSLACLKRYSELRLIPAAEETRKGYKRDDAEVIREIGVGASLGSIFIFTLYLGSPEVKALYSHAHNLWLLAPLMAVFFVRLWISAGRDLVSDDPVVYVLKDRTFHFILLAGAVVLGLSI